VAAAATPSPDLRPPPLPREATPAPAVVGVGGAPGEASSASEGEASLQRSRSEGKGEALRVHGGSAATEDAVTRGLEWLAAHQDADGKWDADGFNRHCPSFIDCRGAGRPELDVGVSGLALLAFLGAGHSPLPSSPYSSVVARGLDFLLEAQRDDGAFGPSHQWFFYSHAIATFAVAEAYGLSRDPRYRAAAASALQFSEAHQQEEGGWDYRAEPTGRNDLSITGWQVMALKAARGVGIPVPSRVLAKVTRYLDAVVYDDGQALYAAQGEGRGRRGVNMAAVGLLSRVYTGTSISDRRVRAAAQRIVLNPPDLERASHWDEFFQSSYYWYVATLALFHLGGEEWEAWNHFLKQSLLDRQSSREHEDGSWKADPNWIGTFGGRLTSTALLVLTFEVYYRYPPLRSYQRAPAQRARGARQSEPRAPVTGRPTPVTGRRTPTDGVGERQR
jgi:hypothetical protein